MQYDPVKHTFGKFFSRAPWLRILFYKLLDLLLLRSWHIHKKIKEWDRLRKRKAVTVLDAGFGFGQYSYYLSGLGNEITVKGLEIKEEQVADCSEFFKKTGRKNTSFFKGDLTQYIEPETFDLILCVDVMEHILEDELVFNNYSKSLKKGGVLLVSTPSDLGGSDVHDHDGTSFIEEHVRNGYGLEEITQKLQRAGFSEIDVSYSYGKFGTISWRLSMKYPILLINSSKFFLLLLPLYYLVIFPVCLGLNSLDVYRYNPAGTGLIVKAIK